MKQRTLLHHTTLKTSYIAPNAKSLEEKIRQAVSTKAPIEAISPIIYTERADGIHPEMDIRTDRQELAIEACEKLTATHLANRNESIARTMKKQQEAMNPAEATEE